MSTAAEATKYNFHIAAEGSLVAHIKKSEALRTFISQITVNSFCFRYSEPVSDLSIVPVDPSPLLYNAELSVPLVINLLTTACILSALVNSCATLINTLLNCAKLKVSAYTQ